MCARGWAACDVGVLGVRLESDPNRSPLGGAGGNCAPSPGRPSQNLQSLGSEPGLMPIPGLTPSARFQPGFRPRFLPARSASRVQSFDSPRSRLAQGEPT